MDIFFNGFGYPRFVPSIFHDIFVGANLVLELSHPFCMCRLDYVYFQANRYTFWSNFLGDFGLDLFWIPYLSFIIQTRFIWLVDCKVESLKIVPHVMRKWYHFVLMFFNQTLYLVLPLTFKHVSNQEPLFGWMKINLFFFISEIR